MGISNWLRTIIAPRERWGRVTNTPWAYTKISTWKGQRRATNSMIKSIKSTPLEQWCTALTLSKKGPHHTKSTVSNFFVGQYFQTWSRSQIFTYDENTPDSHKKHLLRKGYTLRWAQEWVCGEGLYMNFVSDGLWWDSVAIEGRQNGEYPELDQPVNSQEWAWLIYTGGLYAVYNYYNPSLHFVSSTALSRCIICVYMYTNYDMEKFLYSPILWYF
jgi:hypothetical protein